MVNEACFSSSGLAVLSAKAEGTVAMVVVVWVLVLIYDLPIKLSGAGH